MRANLGLHEIARICHEANRAICAIFQETPEQPSWEDAPRWQRESACAGVLAVSRKPNISPEELHDAWCETKLADGWKYGEIKDADRKTHPCLVPYDDLPEAQKCKDHVFRAIVHSLTAR